MKKEKKNKTIAVIIIETIATQAPFLPLWSDLNEFITKGKTSVQRLSERVYVGVWVCVCLNVLAKWWPNRTTQQPKHTRHKSSLCLRHV